MKLEEAKKANVKKVKEKPVAKSLIIFEVKPYEAETDLDELAKKIIAIEMEGLFWKTEYKKAPIAYGVEKIIIGCVVEDEKVSTDDLQEKIEAMDDLVQSVDIAAFNKI
jgi:translation elongation factor EF-1beta